jgi:cation transport ATPase
MEDSMRAKRERRRKVTGVALLLLVAVGYWPAGRIVEQLLSPFWFTIWIVFALPAIVILIFGYNSYRNIQEDIRMTESKSTTETESKSTTGDA